MTAQTSPFALPYNTPHQTIPFREISIADIEQGIREGMRMEYEEINAITENPEEPTFENTIVAFERTGAMLERATTLMYNLLSAETCEELDRVANELSPALSEHNSDIMLNGKLFARVKHVYESDPALDSEGRMLLDKTYEAFERSGATLNEKDKKRFKDISIKLSRLSLQFSQNNLKETNEFTLHLTKPEELDGLPEAQVEQAAQAAKEKGMPGWLITLKAPSYVPFMTYAACRELRRKLYMGYHTRCTHDNNCNNFEIVRDIVNLRQEKARLLGYKSYAHYILKNRMAQSVENVCGLLNSLIGHYKDVAAAEVNAVKAMAQEDQGKDFVLQPWDFPYYSHKLKMARYAIDAEMLRPYFELSNVCKGVFSLATKLYGITFHPRSDIQTYHPDVAAYEVRDADGTYLAVLYTDFFPREGKQSGAWMTNYKEQWTADNGSDSRPHVSITMNFTKPTPTRPALLTLEEVETLLHEFGHALHGIFSKCRYRSLSGTNVYWDFVELPSQFMENYAVEKDFLRTFAFHYQTGELIPDSLVDKIVAARNFNVAYACMRQVSFGLLDMAYYTLEKPLDGDLREFERKSWEAAQLLPQPADTCMSVQFGHIMSGGYAAGYYSYKWAEVLDADAFSLFKAQGIFSRDTARRFRERLLSKGGTCHPMSLYLDFMGREPSLAALLERNGIAHTKKGQE